VKKLRDNPYAGAAGMLVHINEKFPMGKLKSSLLWFVVLSIMLKFISFK